MRFHILCPCLMLGLTASYPCLAQSSTVGPAIELSTLWEMVLGPDLTSTTNPMERNQHPFTAKFYIPSGAYYIGGTTRIPNVVPLYRLINSSGSDHMDSLITNEGGYALEGAIGYVFSGAPTAGLSTISRVYDNVAGTADVGDHATTQEQSPIPHADVLSYYNADSTLGSGYARYPATDQVFGWVSGAGITVKSNLAVGCSLWEWWWNDVEFINDYDYGRQIQSAIYTADGLSALNEAGDEFGPGVPQNSPVLNPDDRHPSPCVSYSVTGSEQQTAAVPLDYKAAGGGIDNPVIYPEVNIGKDLILDWVGPDNIDRHWNVGRYRTTVSLPQPITAYAETPSAYLNSQFTTYGTYNFSTQQFNQLSQMAVQACTTGSKIVGDPNCPYPANGYNATSGATPEQAMIFADGANHAMGVYINTGNAGFTIIDSSSGGTPGETGNEFVKWSVEFSGPIGPTTTQPQWGFNTWIVTDTLANVETALQQFHQFSTTYPGSMNSH